MTKLNKQIFSVITAGALLLNTSGMALAGTTEISINGNSRDSVNVANIETDNKTVVKQDNNARINNNVEVKADTGDNRANDNRGNVDVVSGNTNSTVEVTNTANVNEAVVAPCAGCGQDATVNISDNSRDSVNVVNLDQNNKVKVSQDNRAYVNNNVNVDADTGDNRANDNRGDVTVRSGNVTSSVTLTTTANANSAFVGGNGNGEGQLSATIEGNDRNSFNKIDLDLANWVILDQDNFADVDNDVEVDADTGDNRADDNRGDVLIDAGNINSTVTVDNMVNFNAADVDCGCIYNVTADITDNSRDTFNKINGELSSGLVALQENDAYVDNDLDGREGVDLDTGDNHSDDNRGDVTVNPGNATSTVTLENQANQNILGDFNFPEFEFNTNSLVAWIIGMFN